MSVMKYIFGSSVDRDVTNRPYCILIYIYIYIYTYKIYISSLLISSSPVHAVPLLRKHISAPSTPAMSPDRTDNTRHTPETPSTTNLEEEETVDAPGNDGNASMPEQVKRPNP